MTVLVFVSLTSVLGDLGFQPSPIYDNNKVRPGVNIVLDKDNFSVKITTTENVVGKDTNTLLMAQLEYDGDIKFDVIPVTIKEPTC